MKQRGFSLIEILVVIAIIGIVGIILTEIFLSSIRGGTKATVVTNLKRNGQEVLETMDKNIRNAKSVKCVEPASIIIIQNQEDKLIRYKLETPTSTLNGKIVVDYLSTVDLPAIESGNCAVPGSDASNLTDADVQTGVSVSNSSGLFVDRNAKAGFKDIVTIDFNVGPPIRATNAGQIEVERFQTTIQIR